MIPSSMHSLPTLKRCPRTCSHHSPFVLCLCQETLAPQICTVKVHFFGPKAFFLGREQKSISLRHCLAQTKQKKTIALSPLRLHRACPEKENVVEPQCNGLFCLHARTLQKKGYSGWPSALVVGAPLCTGASFPAKKKYVIPATGNAAKNAYS